jgi:hypothetical protein
MVVIEDAKTFIPLDFKAHIISLVLKQMGVTLGIYYTPACLRILINLLVSCTPELSDEPLRLRIG